MKALAEEKLYWQNEAFKARDMAEKHAAATRNARDEIGVKVATIQRDQVRLNHATDLIKTLARMAGVELPAMNLTTIDPEYLASIADTVTREEEARGRRKEDEPPEYFHIAWFGNGGVYMDTRKLSREDAVKNRAILNQGGKVKLYARVP